MTVLDVQAPADPSPRLRVMRDAPGADLEAAERAVADSLAPGQDPASEHLAARPARLARSFAELLRATPCTASIFPNDECSDQLVLTRDIRSTRSSSTTSCPSPAWPMSPVCRPGASSGSASWPASSTTSPAASRCRSGSPATWPIGSTTTRRPRDRDTRCSKPSTRACRCGAHKPPARTVTWALRGPVRDDPRTRHEFLDLAMSSPHTRHG